MPDIDNIDDVETVYIYNQYVGAQVIVPIGDESRYGKFVQRNRSLDGTVKGCANDNTILDTRTYEVKFPDGHSDLYNVPRWP
jgi:hypothetical protein